MVHINCDVEKEEPEILASRSLPVLCCSLFDVLTGSTPLSTLSRPIVVT